MTCWPLLKVPVRALCSTLVGNNLITGTNLTTKRNQGKPVTHPSRHSLGDSFLTRVGVRDMGVEVETPRFSLSPPAHSSSNDNCCVEAPQAKDFVEDQKLRYLTQSVSLNVVCHVPCATGPSQKKDISPFQLQKRIKSVKPVCCVDHCLCAQHVNSAPLAVENPPVGGRLQLFWQVWLSLGANPRVVSILKEGYSLPFKIRPPLSRSPIIVSHYSDPVKNKHLKESLQALILKQAVGKGHGPFFPGVLQPIISGSKTQQQVEAHPRPQSSEFVPSVSLLQNGNPRDHQTLPSKRGVGHIPGFQRRLLPCSHKPKVTEIPQVSSLWPNLLIHCPPFWPVHGSVGVHQGRQGGQIDGTVPRYPDPPVPRRLVGEGSLSGNVQAAYPDSLGPMSQTRLDCQYDKVRTVSPTGVQLCRLPF